LIEFRCERCGKKLAMVKGTAEIKCPRCKKLNRINTEHRESAS